MNAEIKTGVYPLTFNLEPSSANLALMQRIREKWGDVISQACHSSSIPTAFVAALIANESGGSATAQRFEPGVFRHLCAVRDMQEKRYGSITRETMGLRSEQELRLWSSSWGLTQIMGYHAATRPGGIMLLLKPESHLQFALGLLGGFSNQFNLDMSREFEEMFRCWNTGRPDGKTYDLNYVRNGLERMAAYERLNAKG